MSSDGDYKNLDNNELLFWMNGWNVTLTQYLK